MYRLKKMMGLRVLITGGMGFIGSNLAHKLISLGANVTLYDAMLPQYGGNPANIREIKNKVEFVKGDTRNFKLLAKNVREKDVVFNLAAQVSHPISISHPLLDVEINCIGNLNLLEACRRFNKDAVIVYSGTRGQTGDAVYLPVDEKHPDNPLDINGIDKLAAEKYHLLYNRLYGIPAVSIRIGNTYGPRHQMKHGQYGVLNYFIRKALLGEIIEVYGDGKQIRDYCYVDDVVDALILAAQKKSAIGEVFLIGSGERMRFIDMVRKVIECVGRGSYKFVPFPPGRKAIDVRNYYVSNKKIKSMLGWEPKTSFDTGLRKTVEFYKKRLNEYI
jgi:UDP-glucose 4-epimerase